MMNRAFRAFRHAFLLIVCFRVAPLNKRIRLTRINLKWARSSTDFGLRSQTQRKLESALFSPVLPNR